jgi:hypothetical protein
MKIFADLYNALNTDKPGFSLRKLMAVAAVITGICISTRHANSDNADSLLITWLLFGCVCQGMVTFGDLVSLRTGKTIAVEEISKTKIEINEPAPAP